MKVLQVNAVYGAGSTGRLVRELDAELNRSGVDGVVAYAHSKLAVGYQIGNPLDHKIHALGSRVAGKQGYLSTASTRRLLDFIAGESPDIVHLHNLHSNYINLPMLLTFLAESDIATVVTLHDCWFYTGKCCHYTLSHCGRWEWGCGSCPRLRQDIPSWLFDKSHQMWEDKRRLFASIPRLGVVGVSDWITDEAQRSFLKCAAIVRRIHNWVDLDVFTPRGPASRRPAEVADEEFVALGVSSDWSDAKGLGDFFELSRLISEVGLGRRAELDDVSLLVDSARIALVGTPPHGVTQSPRLQFLGLVPDPSKLASLYRGADVLLQLSREESFGQVVAEALACGTPVIAYDSTANPELVGDGCGHVVRPGDPLELVRALHLVRQSGRAAYSASCRMYAESHFSSAHRVADYLALYEELVAMKRALQR